MAPQNRAPRPQRTKDTCDMCSASKVRCDKEKPICSRCKRLEYPCFYSPARRIRKPSEPAASEPAHTKQASQHQRQEQEKQQQQQAPLQQSMGRNSEPFPTDMSAIDESLTTGSNTPDYFMFGNDGLLPNDIQNWLPPTSSSSMSFPPLMANDQPPNMQMFPSPVSNPISRSGSGSISDSDNCPIEAPDCAATTMELLQNLDRRRSQQSQTPGSSPGSSNQMADLDAVIEESSVAIRRISAVLVCPCSKKADTGLLAAAVCFAILGVYETFLPPNSGNNMSPANSTANGFTNNHRTSSVSNFGVTTNPTPNFSPSNSAAGINNLWSKAPIMRILGELPRVADLVTQFRGRYCSPLPGATRDVDGKDDLFKGMVATMTHRLKSLIDEFTYLLVDVC